MYINPINDAHITFWHIARLGIFTIATGEFQFYNDKEKQKKFIIEISNRSAQLISKCLRNNPSSLRPLIDLHHIELFLIWLMLWQVGREKDIIEWLNQLEAYLLVRRSNRLDTLPFIKSNNRIDLVAEYAGTGKRPYNFTDSSS